MICVIFGISSILIGWNRRSHEFCMRFWSLPKTRGRTQGWHQGQHGDINNSFAQKCILLGCLPPACSLYPVGGGEGLLNPLLDADPPPPWVLTPMDADRHGCRPLRLQTPIMHADPPPPIAEPALPPPRGGNKTHWLPCFGLVWKFTSRFLGITEQTSHSSAIIVKVRNVDPETLVIRTSFSISSVGISSYHDLINMHEHP